MLFRISKIQFFESNSQPGLLIHETKGGCSEYQRYNFLKAIHNFSVLRLCLYLLFRISKIQFFESNSQQTKISRELQTVVQNIKDTIFWKQFTTHSLPGFSSIMLFRISKIQFFESNSQHRVSSYLHVHRCSEYQRYNFLKAIHN